MSTSWLQEFICDYDRSHENKLPEIKSSIYEITFNMGEFNWLMALLLLASKSDRNIYRGQAQKEYKICTTINRLHNYQSHTINTHGNIQSRLEAFKNALMQNSVTHIDYPNLKLLEYARHHGVDSPVIDFTYSPYVALFFSICETQYLEYKPIDEALVNYATLYILDKNILAYHYAVKKSDAEHNAEFYGKRYFGNDETFCDDNYAPNELSIIPHPSAFNLRMKKQQGLLLYDTLYYGNGGQWGEDFEDMISKFPVDISPDSKDSPILMPTLTKIYIDKRMCGAILGTLELMGIAAYSLFPDEYGAALHSKLTNYYNSRSKVIEHSNPAYGLTIETPSW